MKIQKIKEDRNGFRFGMYLGLFEGEKLTRWTTIPACTYYGDTLIYFNDDEAMASGWRELVADCDDCDYFANNDADLMYSDDRPDMDLWVHFTEANIPGLVTETSD